MNTSEIKSKFYDIADNATPAQRRDFDKVMRVMDAIGSPCAPSHYDATLTREVRRAIKWVDAPVWIEWLNEILKAVEENAGGTHDLRGYKKNTHIV